MIGFQVSLVDGSTVSVEADGYSVDTTGALALSGGGETRRTFPAGEWMMITGIGTRLAEVWPPPDLDALVDSVADILAIRFGHYVHHVRRSAPDGDWRLNDLDNLTAHLVGAVGVDARGSSARAEVDAVRFAVARHFHIPG